MRKIYYILPIVLILIFGLFYFLDTEEDFNVSPLILRISSLDEFQVQEKLIIENGDFYQDFQINKYSEIDFFSISSDSFSLESNENKEVLIDFNYDELDNGIYVGALEINGLNQGIVVPIVFEYEKTRPSFDVVLDILPLSLFSGSEDKEKLVFNLYNILYNEDSAKFEYGIIDLNSEVIFSETQDIEVKDFLKIEKEVSIPSGYSEGEYIVFAKISGKDSVGVSSRVFKLGNSGIDSFWIFLIGFVIALVVLIYVIIFLKKMYKKHFDELIKKYNNIKKQKYENYAKELSRLKYKKKLLIQAYNKKYISDRNYNSSLKKLNKKIMKLEKKLILRKSIKNKIKKKRISKKDFLKNPQVIKYRKQISELNYKKNLLKEAYSKKFISRKNYSDSALKLDKKIKKIKKVISDKFE
jgi:hypothetical protein